MSYLTACWNEYPTGFEFRMLETRGAGNAAVSARYLAVTLLEIVRRRLRGQLDLVHINLSSRGSTMRKFVVALECRLLGLPYLIHLHGSQFDIFYEGIPGFGKSLVGWMFSGARHVVVLGESWSRFLVDKVGVDPRKIRIICNGVPSPRVNGGLPPRTPAHIVFLGRLGARKGVPELLKALASKDVRDLDWRATLAGDGDVDGVRSTVAELGLSDRVFAPGWLGPESVEQLLRSADIFVLPSYNEGLPVSVLEALARFIPVVITPVGSLPQFLEDEKSALFVQPGDAEGLATAIRRLVESPELRKRIGEQGRLIFERDFDIRSVADRFIALYKETVATSAPAQPAASGNIEANAKTGKI